MGLALTHSLLTLLAVGGDKGSSLEGPGSAPLLSDISPQAALCAAAVITAIIRFYHGNNQLLESLFGEGRKSRESDSPRGIGVNFIVIMVQSVFFALMSFYVGGSRDLILLFGLLLLLDIFWYVVNMTTVNSDADAIRQQQAWMFNNLGFLVVLTFLYYTKNDDWAVTAGAGAILVNTIIDFGISWDFYFPSDEDDSLEETR